MDELLSTIKKMENKGVAGLDSIPPSFLKSLGPLVFQEFLSIFNSSFSLAHCPNIWSVDMIIPSLKAGKSPSTDPSAPSALHHVLSNTQKNTFW